MDVGNVERVNVMIKELTKNGRVESFDQAYQQAQNIYSNVDSSETVSGAIAREPETPMSVAVDERQLNSLLREKLGGVLQAYNEGIMGEIDALRAQISNLQSQMMSATPAEVHSQLSQTAPVRTESIQEAPVMQQAAQPELTQQESKPANYNQKQGEWSSDDVAVEKMFYFGNK